MGRFAKNVKGGKIGDAMEKINLYEQEPDLIDGLLAITDSARRILLAMKYSKSFSEPTTEQLSLMSLLGISGCAASTRQEAQQLIDSRTLQILTSIAEELTANGSSVKMTVEPLRECEEE
jgi:hypothetical protein